MSTLTRQFFIPTQVANVRGLAEPGAQIYFYATGTSTPQAVYPTATLINPLAQPAVANGAGHFDEIYLDRSKTYRVVITDRDGVVLDDVDPYIPGVQAFELANDTRPEIAAISLPIDNQTAYLDEVGREGRFVFSVANLSTNVTNDPNQGVYIAPSAASGLAIDGSQGAWVRKYESRLNVKWFGAKGDDTTNDGAAFLAALAYIGTIATTGGVYGYPGKSGPTLFVPAGRYFLGTTTLDITTTIILEGESVGANAAQSTVLRWSVGATGIRVQSSNTSGDSTSGLALATSGAGSIIRNLSLYGSYAGASANFYGIHLRASATVQDVFIDLFQGEGVYVIANAGGNNGNANNFRLERVMVQQCRTGIFIDGPDANAGHIIGCSANQCRAWGMWDSSFLGNTYIACHTAGNTSGAYKSDDGSARNVFIGCYSESGQPTSSFVYPTLVLGGIHAALVSGVSWINAEQALRATGTFNIDGSLIGTGVDNFLGPQTGASDSTLYLDNSNATSRINFRRYVAGVPTIDGTVYGSNAVGGLVNEGRTSIYFSITGTGIIADISTAAFNLASGKALNYNGSAVLTTGRLTAFGTPAFAGGDVTSAGGSLVLTLGAGAVTLAKMANLAATSLIGNNTGGAATPVAITLAGGLSFSGTTITPTGGALAPASVAATAAITSSSATAGVGYASGARGTVTQITSKATGVTLNNVTGDITLNAASLAADTTVSFVLTSSAIAANDSLILNHVTTGAFGSYLLNSHGFAAGSCTIDVRNITTGALAEAIVIRYTVIKGG